MGVERAAGGSGVPSLTQPWLSRGASCTESIDESASFSYNVPFHSGRKQRHLEMRRGKSVIIRTMYLEHQKLPQIHRVLAPKRGEQGRASPGEASDALQLLQSNEGFFGRIAFETNQPRHRRSR